MSKSRDEKDFERALGLLFISDAPGLKYVREHRPAAAMRADGSWTYRASPPKPLHSPQFFIENGFIVVVDKLGPEPRFELTHLGHRVLKRLLE